MSELNRLRWRCRRGLLELDLVLGAFVDSHYAALSAEEKQEFAELLSRPDNDLWDMIAGGESGQTWPASRVVALLRQC